MNTMRILTLVLCLGVMQSVASAQWVQTNGPSGGDVRAFAFSGTDMFAGGVNSSLFRTTNHGDQWRLANNGLLATDIMCLAADSNTVYVGTYTQGVYRSVDKGETWTQSGEDLKYNDVYPPVTAMAAIGSHVFLGLNDGSIYRSTNNGDAWKVVSASSVPQGSTRFVGSFVTKGSDIYATRFGHGLMKSTDMGATWTSLRGATTDTSTIVVAASPSSLLTGDTKHGVARSTDGGATWKRSNTGLTDTIIHSMCVQGSNVFVGTRSKGVFISTNDGLSWQQASNGITDSTVLRLISTGTTLFAAARDAGVYRSTDNGSTWTVENVGLANGSGNLVFVSDTTIMALDARGLFASHDNGDTWSLRKINFLETYNATCSFYKNENTFYVGTTRGGIYRSTDFGRSWSRVTESPREITSFQVLDDVLFASTYDDGVYRLYTNSGTITRLETMPNGPVNHLAVSGNRLFAFVLNSGIYRTSNFGTTWEDVGAIVGAAISTIFATDQYLYAGTYSGIYRSSDLGENWQSCSDGLTDRNVATIGKMGPFLYALSRSDTIHLSSNGGTSWTQFDMTGVQYPRSLAFNNSYLFASNSGLGVWRRPVSELPTPVEDTPAQSTPPTLRVHPNPSYANTVISFTLSKSDFVTINIFSVHGEHVATLLSAHLESGAHSVEWSPKGSAGGSEVAGGLYFVHMQSGGEVRAATFLRLQP